MISVIESRRSHPLIVRRANHARQVGCGTKLPAPFGSTCADYPKSRRWPAEPGHRPDAENFAAHRATLAPTLLGASVAGTGRSEERRVGKECRSRWSPYH